MQMTFQQVKDAVAREFPGATAEVHQFINWLEQKDAQIANAKALLEQNGFTVQPRG